jgi:hypothetical protein
MFKKLYPDLYVNSIFDIDLIDLRDKGIEFLIVDIDNTLVSWETRSATKRVINWFQEVQKKGFNICIVSNATKDRVVKFNEDIRVQAVYRAVKPRKKAFLKALNKLNAVPNKTAMIGDQIFTDVLGGNRVGLYTILVVPISGNEFIWTKIVRKVERMILRKMNKEMSKC